MWTIFKLSPLTCTTPRSCQPYTWGWPPPPPSCSGPGTCWLCCSPGCGNTETHRTGPCRQRKLKQNSEEISEELTAWIFTRKRDKNGECGERFANFLFFIKWFIFLYKLSNPQIMFILLQLPQCLLNTLAQEPGRALPLGGLHHGHWDEGAVRGGGQDSVRVPLCHVFSTLSHLIGWKWSFWLH